METYCTRPGCPRPINHFADLDNNATLKTVQQKYCTTCGMPQILIGRYLPIKLLGQGGFGAAFLAIDRYTPTMRRCVVKLFQPSGNLSASQMQVARDLFDREGETLEFLGNRHPQIPDLLAFFPLLVPSKTLGQPDDQFFYLVQEFIDGQNLEQELEQRGKFSQSDALEVLIETLKILKFVHENGSIHRDIKPSNIMRDRSGKLHLLDFGAVKQIAASGGSPSAQSSTGIYSMGFAPPEQMSGNIVYPATDLYALGVTCVMLLTGKQPNELYDPYGNAWNWRAYAQVSDWLEGILNRMLLPTPSQRFQSADEVFEALKQAASGSQPAAAAGGSVTTSPPASAPAAPAAAQSPPVAATASQSAQAAQPSPPVKQPQPTPAPVQQASRPFSIAAFLGGAAFTGFEGGLLAIALASLGLTLTVGTGSWLAIVAVLILLQSFRVIERWDLVFIALATAAIVVFFSPLHGILVGLGTTSDPRIAVLLVAALGGLITVVVGLLFRIIYKILSGLL